MASPTLLLAGPVFMVFSIAHFAWEILFPPIPEFTADDPHRHYRDSDATGVASRTRRFNTGKAAFSMMRSP